MRFKGFLFCILLFYETESAIRRYRSVCPDYCECDVFEKYQRAVCQSKKLVSAEVGVPPQVEILDLSFNQIYELGNRVFYDNGLTDLKLLNLSNNKISQIHMFAFRGAEKLKSLDLSYNIIEYFLEQWYPHWANLEELYLQGNNLVLINKQPVLNIPTLNILDLSRSKIEHFDSNLFTKLPQLEVLDISHNYMQSLNSEVILPIENLYVLIANGNHLECRDKSMSLLRKLIKKRNILYYGPCMKTHKRLTSTTIKPTDGTIIEETSNSVELHKEAKVLEVTGELNKTLMDAENLDKPLVVVELAEKQENDGKEIEVLDETSTVFPVQFEKMMMETMKPVETLPKSEEISPNEAKAKALDKLLKDLERLIENQSTKKPEVQKIAKSFIHFPKNSWLTEDKDDSVDYDDESTENIFESGKNCTIIGLYPNEIDKWIMKIMDVSPILMAISILVAGILLGLIIGCSTNIKQLSKKLPKELPKEFDKGNKILDWFKKKKDNPSQQGRPVNKNKEDPVKNFDEEMGQREVDDDFSDNDEGNSRGKKKIGSGKITMRSPRSRSPIEDQSVLLDNEFQDESTPVLGKKKGFSENDD
ncbi:unnamed protein product [Phyllotreta striolata]|uniref:Uncharacterized protein n=1 Tax=Phyllotreta striolata TaxID=444603 RepID=A0A9N9TXN6_PHYSR|nr:unnamed protein product [Phyllotreta striolata]